MLTVVATVVFVVSVVVSSTVASSSFSPTNISQVSFTLPHFAVIVAVPALSVLTLPLSSTVATEVSLELQLTVGSVVLSGDTFAVRLKLSPAVTIISSLSTVTVSACWTAVILHTTFLLSSSLG